MTWIVAGTLARYVLKLGSSVVLTRMLFPEAFGLVATLALLTTAVEMCSDLGIRQAIVQNPRGGTPRYLDSAWTMRVTRGFILAAVIASLGWPFAAFFKQPILVPMVWVVSVGAFLRGATSPAILLLDRNLELGKLAALELGSDFVRVAATIAAAVMLRNVWGLVIGGLIGELARLVGSFVVASYVPHLRWDPKAMRELFRYGRFVLVSSLLGYGASRLDTLMVAKFLGMTAAGVYYIATALAMIFAGVFTEVCGRVLFPALSRCQDDAGALQRSTYEVVRIIGIVILPLATIAAVNARFILWILYDPRYAEAALALRWLCVAACGTLVADSLNAPLMATGRPYFGTIGKAASLFILCVAAPILGTACGAQGYAGAMALAAGGFIVPMLVGCVRHGHMTLGAFLGTLVLPGGFGLILVAGHLFAGGEGVGVARWSALCVFDLGLLVALWALNWNHLRRFLPQRLLRRGEAREMLDVRPKRSGVG